MYHIAIKHSSIFQSFTDFINSLYETELLEDKNGKNLWVYKHDSYSLPVCTEIKKYGNIIKEFFDKAPKEVEEFDPATMPGYTPVEERDIFDFTWKYSSDILSSSISNFVIQGASAYTGGSVGGAAGISKSILTVASISTAKSYNAYTSDKIEESEDYMTVENIAALGVAGYITSGSIISASAAIATATTPLLIGAAALQTFAAMSSTYFIFGIGWDGAGIPTQVRVIDLAEPLLTPQKFIYAEEASEVSALHVPSGE